MSMKGQQGAASAPLGPDPPDPAELLSPVVWLDAASPSAELNKGRVPPTPTPHQTITLTSMKARDDQDMPAY